MTWGLGSGNKERKTSFVRNDNSPIHQLVTRQISSHLLESNSSPFSTVKPPSQAAGSPTVPTSTQLSKLRDPSRFRLFFDGMHWEMGATRLSGTSRRLGEALQVGLSSSSSRDLDRVGSGSQLASRAHCFPRRTLVDREGVV